MLVYFLQRNAGFFSEVFFMVNYYLISQRNNFPFGINTSNWLFKYEKGWHDYFNSLNEIDENTQFYLVPNRIPEEIDFCENLNFTILDYRNACLDIFQLNDKLTIIYNSIIRDLDLYDYHSIFIRRGDKMIQESVYISTSKYIDLLLEKENVKTIFIQTDDYNVYLEAKKYINSLNLDIRIVTTCPITKKGVHMFGVHTKGSELSKENDIYIKNQDVNTKPIIQYNNEEIFDHTVEMLIGLEICKHSRFLALDMQSNVSRYLLLTHDKIENVLDMQNTSIDFNKPILCPSIGIKYKSYLYLKNKISIILYDIYYQLYKWKSRSFSKYA
jgi:hypothetical protein